MNGFLTAAPQAASFWAMLASGLLAFVSPCVLPMLPIYAVYLMGGTEDGHARWLLWRRCAGLLLGFVIPFVLLGAGAGLLGGLLANVDRGALDIASGVLMILFGLWMMDVFRIGFHMPGLGGEARMSGFFGSIVFGLLMAISWTPCMTPLLANALVLAASADGATMWTGVWMLTVFALGLSLPLVAVLLMYQWLKRWLGWLRERQAIIRRIGGGLMLLYGLYMVGKALLL